VRQIRGGLSWVELVMLAGRQSRSPYTDELRRVTNDTLELGGIHEYERDRH